MERGQFEGDACLRGGMGRSVDWHNMIMIEAGALLFQSSCCGCRIVQISNAGITTPYSLCNNILNQSPPNLHYSFPSVHY